MPQFRLPVRPAPGADVVLDTDTYNEVDDQFALSYLLRCAPVLNTKAIFAAPFFNRLSSGPADGMEKSYREILHLLSLMEHPSDGLVFRGSDRWLPDETTPVDSPAARRLIGLSREYTPERPLYVVAIGALTNIASALLLDPTLSERITLVWLGGNARFWPDTDEFNLRGDIAAARVVFASPVPLVQLPCMGVVSAFTVSDADLARWFAGANPLCDYLASHTAQVAHTSVRGPWSRVIWDVTAVAWLMNGFTEDSVVPAPMPGYDLRYATVPDGRPMRAVYHIRRDPLFRDLVCKLSGRSFE